MSPVKPRICTDRPRPTLPRHSQSALSTKSRAQSAADRVVSRISLRIVVLFRGGKYEPFDAADPLKADHSFAHARQNLPLKTWDDARLRRIQYPVGVHHSGGVKTRRLRNAEKQHQHHDRCEIEIASDLGHQIPFCLYSVTSPDGFPLTTDTIF